MKKASDLDRLALRANFVADADAYAAFAILLNNVLGADLELSTPAGPWHPLAFFDADGRCVAGLEIGTIPLVLDGVIGKAAAIRSVATDQMWRGLGLFRRLMREALLWCEGCAPDATLLYTASPALYERFGFRLLPQHAFAGETSPCLHPASARRMDLETEQDRVLLRNLIARRAPVSERCALLADPALVLANIARDGALELLYDSGSDTLAVVEQNEDELVLVDIFASRIPPLSTLMRLIAPKATRVKCLFPPDQLEWDGVAEPEDTGLMIRGPIPPAMKRAFMFPPTSEF